MYILEISPKLVIFYPGEALAVSGLCDFVEVRNQFVWFQCSNLFGRSVSTKTRQLSRNNVSLCHWNLVEISTKSRFE